MNNTAKSDPRDNSSAADAVSIVHGIPLDQEPGLGVLTLPGFLREVTTRYADSEALVLRTGESTVRWSYAQLWEQAQAIARSLLACGAGKDTRVGVLMTNRPEWVAAFFGVGLAGGVPVALSTFSTVPELEYLLQVTGVSTLLFERSVGKKDFAAMLGSLEPAALTDAPGELRSTKFPCLRRLVAVDSTAGASGIESWSQFLQHGVATPPALIQAIIDATKPADTAALFLSSGSTARPKGIISSHRAVAIQLWRWARIFALKDNVRSWTANGFIWSGNFGMVLGATLAVGGSIVLQRMFDPAEALELVQAEQVTFVQAWPHQWAQLEAAPNWLSVDLSSLRYADRLKPVGRHPTFRDHQWTDPLWCYGNTETFTITAAYPSDTALQIADGSHGEALPGNTLKVVDPVTNAVLPRGQEGELAVKGPTLMLGYLGVPLSESLDEQGFFHTGDAGVIDERGRVHYNGRLSDIIKTGGANVSPLEVDDALLGCPGVKFAKTVGVPHETLGEMVVSCVVATEGAAVDEAAVRGFLKERLATYKVPRRVFTVTEEEVSLTGSAKIKASALRELVVKRMSAEAPADAKRASA
jgi:fatty-acyl-CoA synthase